jgi:Copper amine oxidase, enzyme domain
MPGTTNFADWNVSWSIPTGWGGGLVISKASFRNVSVLYRGTAPFVLVPYHGNSPIFKDGLNHQGAPFTPVLPTSANAPVSWKTPPASNDNQWDLVTNPQGAVVVEKQPATLLEPARLVIWAKLQCANYQYVHRWAFNADGSFEPGVGLGGKLFKDTPGISDHVHNFYFRLDFDIGGAANNAVQQFEHPNNSPFSDTWTTITTEGKRTASRDEATKWRVVNKTPKPNGMLRSYEITSGSDMGPDHVSSSADLWVLAYDPAQDGAAVGTSDSVLDTTYRHPIGTIVDGADVVVWHCLRHHHETRQLGEETITLPYEFLTFHVEPRDFLDATPTNLYPTTPPSP